MAYKIAVASADGIHIDRSFGGTEAFLIYEVSKEGAYHLSERRKLEVKSSPADNGEGCLTLPEGRCRSSRSGESSGMSHQAGCCGRTGENNPKVALVEDCRCIICQKVGFQVQKQLERKAIISFDVSCQIEEALEKITRYFDRVDRHQSLRGL